MDEQQHNREERTQQISSDELLTFSVGSGVIYVLIALLLIYYFHDTSLLGILGDGMPVLSQLVIGALFGILAAVGVGFVSYRPPVSDILRDFAIIDLISQTRFTLFDRIQISFVAGTCEEILFRGAIQPLIGVWWTSLIFVALHGYFMFKSLAHIMLGLMMFTLSAALGFLFEWVGLIAAMTAHAVYDFLLLQAVHKWGLGK